MQIIKKLGTVTILASGQIEVRLDAEIVDDSGVTIGYPQERYWRGVVDPGDTARAQELGVGDISAAAWTPEVLAEWSERPVDEDA